MATPLNFSSPHQWAIRLIFNRSRLRCTEIWCVRIHNTYFCELTTESVTRLTRLLHTLLCLPHILMSFSQQGTTHSNGTISTLATLVQQQKVQWVYHLGDQRLVCVCVSSFLTPTASAPTRSHSSSHPFFVSLSYLWDCMFVCVYSHSYADDLPAHEFEPAWSEYFRLLEPIAAYVPYMVSSPFPVFSFCPHKLTLITHNRR